MNHSSYAQDSKSIGILGGGIAGLTAAYYLLSAGHKVTVVEASARVGGLTTFFDFGLFYWDRFYHCILTSDRWLRELLDDLKLTPDLCWQETKVGFYANDKLYSLSNGWDFLTFPVLSLWEKFRFALGIIYVSRIRNGRALENIPVATWLRRVFGRGNYEKLWAPLLRCKLGACREKASAAFIWATITRLFSTRDRGAGRERLGYVRGGYRSVLARILREIEQMGGEVVTDSLVKRIESRPDGAIDFVTDRGTMRFDAAIVTTPSPVFSRLAPSLPEPYHYRLNAATYLGMVCVVLVLKKQLTPFYVLNLADQNVPFTGVIEMTNLVSLDETAGHHLVYLPKYTAPDDWLFEASDDEVWATFRPHLGRICPEFSEDTVERRIVLRERLVQPLPVLQYSDLVPSMRTGIPNLFLANTTQIVNSTLNNNEMVRIARQAVDAVLEAFQENNQKSPPNPASCEPVLTASESVVEAGESARLDR